MRPEIHPIEPEELMAYLDGELPPQSASEAASHLPHCRECQERADEMQTLALQLLVWQVDDIKPKVERAVNLVSLPEAPNRVWRRRAPWILGVAAIFLASVIRLAVNAPQITRSGPTLASRAVPLPYDRSVVTEPEDRAEPLIARTAQITLSTSDFAGARASLEAMVNRRGGHIGSLTLTAPANEAQTLQATLRVPVSQLDAALAEVRRLGRIESEQQSGEKVTRQAFDLDARLANSRNTEQRLSDILRRNTGKISDVLEVEREISRVRGTIESMEAERKDLHDRVTFATLNVRINEDFKARPATAPSTVERLRSSAVEGFRNAAGSLGAFAAFLLTAGPTLILWVALLFFPVRYAWRKLR